MNEVKVVHVYPKLRIAKGLFIAGVGYLCYTTGKLVQKLVDRYDIKNGTITFDEKEKESE